MLDSHDFGADWALWSLPSISRECHNSLSLAQEKIKIRSVVSTDWVSLLYHRKVEN